ncbi:leucine-rich repeat-containing protein 74B-like [Galleria mellonella]|uniref:Leucine-rich repeat-containing protein 74B-like n=1 Tax=Galleria mellonella TaxID=7137 RepID=A0A6J1WR95_GALME|nr:leucine-rich repeat-containing protein 74B-like [Galleria mellonella]
MSSEDFQDEPVTVDVMILDTKSESSVEPPIEEWPSLVISIPEENNKRAMYKTDLYSPGSGEICTKYISMSDSSIFRHPYYNYPAVLDPGIENALFAVDEKKIYPDDGQELYVAVCKDMNQHCVKIFQKGLLEEVIDLKYYCVNSAGVRPMAIALQHNKYVKILNVTDNFLNEDACYHLGEMLTTNCCLCELILSGCRIGPAGARRLFAGLAVNRALKILDLSRNQLGDTAMEYIANAIVLGLDVKKIYLSYNNISGKGVGVLAEAFQTHNKFTHLDLSWNNLFSPLGVYNFLSSLSENKFLQELNLTWNSMSGPRLGTAIKNCMVAPNLRHLNLSNNKLSGEAITNLIGNMSKAKKLVTLDLSYNPMTPDDALLVLTKMKSPAVKLQTLLMNNVFVNSNFLDLLQQLKEMKSKRNTVVTYGGSINYFKPQGVNIRELVLNRAEYLAKKSRKHPVDIALVALQLLKDKYVIMSAKDFSTAISKSGAPLDDDLIDEIVNAFAGPKLAKSKTIDIRLLADYVKRKWPERQLPPSPLPEPEPEPIPKPVKNLKAGKGGKKGKK